MANDSIYIQLSWDDPDTGEQKELVQAVPVALGRDFSQLPETVGDQQVSRIVLDNKQVSRFHALITSGANRQLLVVDRSANGSFLNGRRVHQTSQPLGGRDTLRIGPYKILVAQMSEGDTEATELNVRDSSRINTKQTSPMSTPIAKMAIGTGLVLAMGIAAWIFVSSLLQKLRPQTDDTPIPQEEIEPVPADPPPAPDATEPPPEPTESPG